MRILLLSCLLISKCTSDICTFNSTNSKLPSTWSYSTIEQVKNCFENISINKSLINKTREELFNSLNFYSFLSIIHQSNSPYNMKINLNEQLNLIFNQSNIDQYKNDYNFHLTIVSCFKKLKDFHTKYFAPYGYRQFYLLLPFIFQYMPSTKQIQVKDQIDLYFSLTKQNISMNYTNKILTKIDGINSLDCLKQFANDYSLMSKDEDVRLNSVFREEFWLRNLGEYPLPDKNNITLTFFDNNEITITFPYIIITTKQFNNQIDIENDNQFSLSYEIPNRNVFNYIINSQKLNWYEEKTKENFEFIIGSNETYHYIHKPTNISIVRIGSFNDDVSDMIKQIFSRSMGQTLIIDLIGNHGGHSCLAYGLLNYLVPEYSSLKNLYEPMDGRTTEFLISFAKIFQMYPNSILDLRNFSSFTNLEWIQPHINYTRGNLTNEYSMKWSINCDGIIFGAGKYWIEKTNSTKSFQSIYVLTDGICGSACSLFLSKLKYASNIKFIYGIGGGYDLNNDLFESSSYAGGGAFNWNDIVMYYQQVNNNTLINYLPTSAFLNLNVFEIYINQLDQNYPREFLKQPIDRLLNTGDYFNLDQPFETIINDHLQSNGNELINYYSWKINIFLIFFILFK